jgi:anti-sigma B factor antagonist
MGAGGAFDVTSSAEGNTVTLTLVGELDLASAPRLRDAFAEAVQHKPETVRVDLAGLTFLDSSGISVLVQAQQDLQERSSSFVLHRVGDRTARVLEIAGLDNFFARSDQPTE